MERKFGSKNRDCLFFETYRLYYKYKGMNDFKNLANSPNFN